MALEAHVQQVSRTGVRPTLVQEQLNREEKESGCKCDHSMAAQCSLVWRCTYPGVALHYLVQQRVAGALLSHLKQ